MTNFKDVQNVQPLADFNWDEFEKLLFQLTRRK